MVDLDKYLSLRKGMIEEQLSLLVPEQTTPHQILFQAARYSLLGGGKRLRPILALATAETLGGSVELAMVPACTLELIHTYSLIHDDLPCMDDDDFRRGKPSLHRAFPEGHAVLAGDYLLTHAFDVLVNYTKLSSETRLTLLSTLSSSAGGEGMIAGQVMDLEAEGKEIELEQLRLLHSKKTGALLVASIEFGAVIANASKGVREVLKHFGQDIGLAFQIRDDVLDVTESKKKHGKLVSSDVTNQKSTYVTVLGLEQSQVMVQTLLNSALEHLKQLPFDTKLLAQLAQYLLQDK